MVKNILILISVAALTVRPASGRTVTAGSSLSDMGLRPKSESAALSDLPDSSASGDAASYASTYRTAYEYYLQDDFVTALRLFKQCRKYKDAPATVYKMIGNIEDILGNANKALRAYGRGLDKFPDSGLLYFEGGMTNLHYDDFAEALKWFEWGIQADPYFSSNYYYAALLNLFIWGAAPYGLVQGEIFINLEPDSRRTEVISGALYESCGQLLAAVRKPSAETYLSGLLSHSAITSPLFSIPFPTAYEAVFCRAAASESDTGLGPLDRIRSRFLDIWFDEKRPFHRDYTTPLFDYQQTVREAGHFEAYTHWLMADGDPEASEEWRFRNRQKHEAFIEWFNENPISLD